MATYGKKKRSILPSFSVLRDSDTEPKLKKSLKRGSKTLSMSAFQDNNFNKESPSNHHDDSIEEMASMLLDDTTLDQLRPEAGRRLCQIAAAKALPELERDEKQDSKARPRILTMTFNGDDAWAMRTAPVVTAAGRLNLMDFSDDNQSTTSFGHPINRSGSSAPAIPRKSSKRKSGRPKSSNHKLQIGTADRSSFVTSNSQAATDIFSSAEPAEEQPKTSVFQAADVNGKIDAMLAATKSLKPGSEVVTLQEPLVPTKKRRLMDNKVLAKMKTAINDRFPTRNGRKRDSIREERLLESSTSEVQAQEEDPSGSGPALSTMEIRMNEGDNFKNPKIYTLTGHGNVRRKPLADDGRSLKSHKSNDQPDDPFAERPGTGGITRTPTNFETRLRDDMSQSQGSEFIPDLPSRDFSDLPSRCQTPKIASREKRIKTSLYGSDFDAMLSSSPVAQSTPRIRLEPTFEEGGKKSLKNVPVASYSLFDPDSSISAMDIDSELSSRRLPSQDFVKRKTSTAKISTKRVKKHPSPSKSELEILEMALQNFTTTGASEDLHSNTDKPLAAKNTLAPASVLGVKDTNRKLRDTRRYALKIGPMKTTESMPNLPGRSKGREEASAKDFKLADGARRQYKTQNDLVDNSMMDIDELQWDHAAYHIGSKKV